MSDIDICLSKSFLYLIGHIRELAVVFSTIGFLRITSFVDSEGICIVLFIFRRFFFLCALIMLSFIRTM
ncbi:MAG: hypothetical protein CMJ88_04115 [Planctomycetes bacterium]|nr:hypothetical protein [Planctomycetota bacterium]